MMTNPAWLFGLDPVGKVLWLLMAPNALPAWKSAMVLQVIVLLRWLSLARHLEPKAYWRVDKAATQGPRTALTRRGYTLKVDSRTSLITARVYWPARSRFINLARNLPQNQRRVTQDNKAFSQTEGLVVSWCHIRLNGVGLFRRHRHHHFGITLNKRRIGSLRFCQNLDVIKALKNFFPQYAQLHLS